MITWEDHSRLQRIIGTLEGLANQTLSTKSESLYRDMAFALEDIADKNRPDRPTAGNAGKARE
jgi:hypothetical protein